MRAHRLIRSALVVVLLFVARGESTEITTCDNDFYLTGQRATAKRPANLCFESVFTCDVLKTFAPAPRR